YDRPPPLPRTSSGPCAERVQGSAMIWCCWDRSRSLFGRPLPPPRTYSNCITLRREEPKSTIRLEQSQSLSGRQPPRPRISSSDPSVLSQARFISQRVQRCSDSALSPYDRPPPRPRTSSNDWLTSY